MKRALVLLMVLLVPGVMGFPGDEVEGASSYVTEYRIDSYNDQFNAINTDQVLFNQSFNASKLHNAHVVRHELQYLVELHFNHDPSSNGVWRLWLQHDGADVGNCFTEFVTGNPGTLGGSPEFYHSITLHCASLPGESDNNHNHNHSVGLRVEEVSGSPDEFDLGVSLEISRLDTAVYPMDVNITNLETWIPIVVLGLLFLWAVWNDFLLVALVSSMGVALQYLEAPPIALVGIVYLLITAIWLEYLGGLARIFKLGNKRGDAK